MVRRYYINPLAVLFHPELDIKNNYKTIIRNPTTEKILAINSFSYDILKIIDENSGSDIENISRVVARKRGLMVWQVELKIAKFMEQMVKENIVLEK